MKRPLASKRPIGPFAQGQSDPKLAIVFEPKSGEELGEDMIIQHRNAIVEDLNSKLINVDTVDVLNKQETSALLGGFSDSKSVRVVKSQKSMGKPAPTRKSQIDKMQKAIVKRTGKQLSDNYAVFVI